jgi:hypothetical protein
MATVRRGEHLDTVVGATSHRRSQLTPRERRVLFEIRRHVAERGYAPSRRELSTACGLGGVSAAQRTLKSLESKGHVRLTAAVSRGIASVDATRRGDPIRGNQAALLAGAAASQAVIRDATLIAAVGIDDSAIKGVLIEDARQRHELVIEISRRIPSGDEVDDPTVQFIFQAIQGPAPWPIFIVDHFVYNRTLSVVARRFEVLCPDVAGTFGEIAALADRATEASEGWLHEVARAFSGPGELQNLRLRARAMTSACARAASAVQRRWLDESLPLLRLLTLPEVLVDRPPLQSRSP